MMVRMGALHGLRVLEFEAIGPAPFAGMMLADMGADVLLIDRAVDVFRRVCVERHRELGLAPSVRR